MRVVAIIQARTGSERFPNKVLQTVLGKPLLELMLERVRRSALCEQVIVATTSSSRDDPIAELCERVGCSCIRGSVDDVLGRYATAVTAYPSDIVVRLTADCPLMDPRLIDDAIRLYQAAQPSCHYVTNALERSYPHGMDVEVFSQRALLQAAEKATDPYEREHVTPYLYSKMPAEGIKMLANPSGNFGNVRLTLDYPEDLEVIERVFAALGDDPIFSLNDILRELNQHPQWLELNAKWKRSHKKTYDKESGIYS